MSPTSTRATPRGMRRYAAISATDRARRHRSQICCRSGAVDSALRSPSLVVDTRATTERDLTLVARDIKARYANLDSVSVEFIDSNDFLAYRGGALIFNTAAGAYFQGFVYGPPNNKGYLVNAAD